MSEMSGGAKIAGAIYCIVLLVLMIAAWPACSNPYIAPETSKAISEEKQIELLKEQNKLLERIAVAIENKNK